MASNRDQDLKDFLIAIRKKIGAGVTNAPVWAMQKAGKRIWNQYGKRHWRSTNLGKQFRKEND